MFDLRIRSAWLLGVVLMTLGNVSADLIITQTVNDATPIAGQKISLTLTVTNTGPAMVYGIRVCDQLPMGLAFVSSSASQGAYSQITKVWTLGDMAAYTSATCTIVARAQIMAAGMTLINTASIQNAYGDVVIYGQNQSASLSITVQSLSVIANAFSFQPTSDIYRIASFLGDGDGIYSPMAGYVVVSGDVAEGMSLYAYVLDAYTSTFNLLSSGTNGFDVQPFNSIYTVKSVDLSHVYDTGVTTYLAAAGGDDAGTFIRLYSFNEAEGLFTLIPDAFDVQPSATVYQVQFFTAQNPYTGISQEYVVTGGVFYNGISASVYRIDQTPSISCIQVTSGVAGFATQYPGNISSLAPVTINGTVYMAAAGADFTGSMIRLYQFDSLAEQFVELSGAIDVQPQLEALSVVWLESSGVWYLIASSATGLDVGLRIYQFDPSSGTFSSLSNVFDFLPPDSLNKLFIIFVGSSPYLVAVGNVFEQVTTYLYSFDSETITFSRILLALPGQRARALYHVNQLVMPALPVNYLIVVGAPDQKDRTLRSFLFPKN